MVTKVLPLAYRNYFNFVQKIYNEDFKEEVYNNQLFNLFSLGWTRVLLWSIKRYVASCSVATMAILMFNTVECT